MATIFGDEMKRGMLEDVPARESLERVDRKWNELLGEEAVRIGNKDAR